MNTTTNTRLVRDLHPRVYAALIGLSLWFVVWAWSFFGAGVTNYLLFINGFISVVIALWLILSSVKRPTAIANSNTNQPPSFHDWVRSDFETEHGPEQRHRRDHHSSADGGCGDRHDDLRIEFLVVEHAV